MIVAAGLSPAWQQIMRFEHFESGEVNRAAEVHWCASGKVLNVGVALASLGANVEVISSIGGLTGEQIRQDFVKLGVPATWIEVAVPTRVCTTLLDANRKQVTELVENAGPITADELTSFQTAYTATIEKKTSDRAMVAVLSGSLPAGAPPTLFRELLDRTRCPAVLDIRGPELWEALACRPLLVKPNREELGRTVGRELSGDQDVRQAIAELHARGARWVAITQGAEPLWVSGPDGEFRLQPSKVTQVNPIGAGDCFAAGTAWGLAAGEPMLESLRLGMAAAAENVAQLLPARLDSEAVRRRAATITIHHV